MVSTTYPHDDGGGHRALLQRVRTRRDWPSQQAILEAAKGIAAPWQLTQTVTRPSRRALSSAWLAVQAKINRAAATRSMG